MHIGKSMMLAYCLCTDADAKILLGESGKRQLEMAHAAETGAATCTSMNTFACMSFMHCSYPWLNSYMSRCDRCNNRCVLVQILLMCFVAYTDA